MLIQRWLLSIMFIIFLGAFILSLAFGSVPIPIKDILHILIGQRAAHYPWSVIILNFRLPKALTAILAGSALAISGLQMQTLFRNPLADPFILGVSAGASLGAAIVVLAIGTTGTLLLAGLGLSGDFSLASAASFGAASVLVLVLLVSKGARSSLTLLILGLMFNYITTGIVSLLFYFSIPERLQTYLAWTFGSFGGVTWGQLVVMAPVIVLGIFIAYLLPKQLNVMMLGETYARSMGLNVRRTRLWIIISASMLAGTVTAFCGPIGFLGIAVPHLCRGFFNTSDHRLLIPASTLLGAILALLADLAAQMPGSQYVLPLNAVTSLLGAPVVIWVLLRQPNLQAGGMV
jgi:iron complex transport system permease protein